MNETRRRAGKLMGLSLAAAALWPLAGAVRAAEYPERPITFLIPQAAGGSTDTLAREIGGRLAAVLGQAVVMDNRAGANGIIGTELVAKSRPDGYTLLVGGTGTMAINQHLYAKIPYDPVKAFVPVAMFGYSTSVLVVNPAVTAKTIGELMAQAKAKPGEFKYASAGMGSSPHLTAEMFRMLSGVDILHIPYKGSTPGVMATMAGDTQLMFTGVASALQQIKGGRLRALSITGPKRSAALPEVPTASESGLPGFEAEFWIGLFAPAGTPREVVARLNAEVNRILESPAMKDKFFTIGVDPMAISPQQFGDILARDVDRWGKTVKSAGLKGE